MTSEITNEECTWSGTNTVPDGIRVVGMLDYLLNVLRVEQNEDQ